MSETFGNGAGKTDRQPEERKQAFSLLVPDITITLPVNLGIELGFFIMDNRPLNPAIRAIGTRLRDISPPEPVPPSVNKNR